MSCNTMNIAASSMKHVLMFLIIPVYLSIYTYMEMQYCTQINKTLSAFEAHW